MPVALLQVPGNVRVPVFVFVPLNTEYLPSLYLWVDWIDCSLLQFVVKLLAFALGQRTMWRGDEVQPKGECQHRENMGLEPYYPTASSLCAAAVVWCACLDLGRVTPHWWLRCHFCTVGIVPAQGDWFISFFQQAFWIPDCVGVASGVLWAEEG